MQQIALIDDLGQERHAAGRSEAIFRALPDWPQGWLLGQPDLIVKPSQAFTLPAQSTDAFRIFAIKVPVTKRTYVRGIEFHPGNARVVHHANIRIDRTAATRQLDEADPLPGYDGLMPRSAEYPDGHFLGWTPGQVAPLVAPELAWTLEPGSDLVVQLHMQPSGAVEQVQPEIGFFFSDRPPTRTPTILRLGSQGIEIPPGEARYVIRDAYTLPVDVELLAVQPHAHYRAREIRGVATLPDGTSRLVMHIKDWDFRWQHVYREVTPIRLPKGTRLSMEYTYDNSAANVRNPQLPPARVFWGQRSQDEMGDLWFQLLAGNDRDRAALNTEIARKMTAEDIVGYETMLRADPRDAELHDDVALLYLGLGQSADAVRHFRVVGVAQARLGRSAFQPRHRAGAGAGDSTTRLRPSGRRWRSRPDYALAHNNLGRVLLAQGKTGEALKHLTEAVRLDAANPQALFGLAEAYAAVGSYRRGDRRDRPRPQAADDGSAREAGARQARAVPEAPPAPLATEKQATETPRHREFFF